jgi:hypothetical protein
VDRPHVKEGSLIAMLGNITGIVLARTSKFYYKVWAEGMVHELHRDDFVILRTGYGEDEEDGE